MREGSTWEISLEATTQYEAADGATRFGAALLDILPDLLIVPLSLVPVVGQILGGILGFLYWLLRDAAFGRSLGKKMVGLYIIDAKGKRARSGALIARNLPLCICHLLIMIPVIGYVFAVANLIIYVVELILIFSSGSRMGDRLGGTRVVKERKITAMVPGSA